jgi:two-component sensor histidine kinase
MVRSEQRLQQAFEKQEQRTVEQETLAGDMGHRVQNLFAIFGGMVRVSARSAATPAEMSEILSGRLVALAASHALVRRTLDEKGATSQGAELGELVPTILRPYEGEDALEATRFRIAGPPVRVSDRATNGFALFLHEFATNAAKYGALKIVTGSVQVSWARAGSLLVLIWEEQGGPAIHGEPTKQGFGSALAMNTVIAQLGGTLVYDWRKTGLFVTITVPFAKLSD